MYSLLKNYIKNSFPKIYLVIKKYVKYVKRIVLFFSGVVFNPPLTSVEIETSSVCNRKCPWCPNYDHNRKPAFLDKDVVCKVIDELKGMNFGGEIFFHLYNEPLLDKRLSEFIRYTRRMLPSAIIRFNTNGDLLDLSSWKDLRSAGLNFAIIRQYDGKINDNIQNILDVLDEEERKHFSVRIFDIKKIDNRAGLVKIDKIKNFPLKKYCPRPFYDLCINYEGKAVLCCSDYSGEVTIGDVRKESIKNIWRSKILRYYRKKLFFGNREALKLCKSCDYYLHD